MTIGYETGYTLPSGDLPLTHARVLHNRNWVDFNSFAAFPESTDYPATALANTLTYERFRPHDNLVPARVDFNNGWTLTNVTVSGDGMTLDEGTVTGLHRALRQITYANTSEHIFGVVIERTDCPEIQLEAIGGASSFRRWFNLDDMTVGLPAGGPNTGNLVDLGDNKVLCSIVFTPAVTTGYLNVQMADGTQSSVYTGTGNTLRVLEMWAHENVGHLTALTLGSNAADCMCIAAHNIGTRGGTVYFLHDHNADGTYTEMGSVTPTSDSPIMFLFGKVTSARWRLRIEGAPMPEIGVWRVGKALQMQRQMYGGHSPADLARQTTRRVSISETGETLGRVVQRSNLAAQYSWSHVTAAWVRANWAPLIRAAETEAMFIAWRPDAFGEVVFGEATGSGAASNMGLQDLMQIDLQLRGNSFD